jgi:hypothetical protein
VNIKKVDIQQKIEQNSVVMGKDLDQVKNYSMKGMNPAKAETLP